MKNRANSVALSVLLAGLAGCKPAASPPPAPTAANPAEQDVCANVADLPHVPFIFVTSPRSGQAVKSGFTVSGCSRTWESHIQWVLRDQEGKELATGSGHGGGVDGPAAFSFQVSYPKLPKQIAHLQVYEEGADPEAANRADNLIPVVLE